MQAENANALHKNSSDSETDRLQDSHEEPHRCIGPSCVKELAKFFNPTSDEEDHSCVNTRTRRKKLFEPKEKDSVMFPREIIVIPLPVFVVRS